MNVGKVYNAGRGRPLNAHETGDDRHPPQSMPAVSADTGTACTPSPGLRSRHPPLHRRPPSARLELEVAYTTLLRRLPGLHPAQPPADTEWKGGVTTIGPSRLVVTW